MTPSILVTGGAGFIGSQVAEAFLEKGWRVAVVDDLSTGKRENLPPGVSFHEEDITDGAAVRRVFERERPRVVCHQAAQTSVRLSTEDPARDLAINIGGTLNLIGEALRAKTEIFAFSSTGGAIYGDGVPLPTAEDAPCMPVSPYGVGKLGAEHYLEWAERTHGLPCLRLRYANVYGPKQDPHGEAGVVAIFAQQMLAGRDPVVNGDGRQTRDYIYVGDVVAANVAGIEQGAAGVYNIGTGLESDVVTLFDKLAPLAGYRGERRHGPAKPGEQLRSCIDPSAFAKRCGWKAAVGLDEGLERTVDWFRERRDA